MSTSTRNLRSIFSRRFQPLLRKLAPVTAFVSAIVLPAVARAATLTSGDFGDAGTAGAGLVKNAGAVVLAIIATAGGIGFMAAGIGHARNPEHSEVLHKVGGIAAIVGVSAALGAVMLAKGGDMATHIAAAAGALIR